MSKEPYLIYIKASKYQSSCKECTSAIDIDDKCYWNPRTKEVFCMECGLELNYEVEDMK